MQNCYEEQLFAEQNSAWLRNISSIRRDPVLKCSKQQQVVGLDHEKDGNRLIYLVPTAVLLGIEHSWQWYALREHTSGPRNSSCRGQSRDLGSGWLGECSTGKYCSAHKGEMSGQLPASASGNYLQGGAISKRALPIPAPWDNITSLHFRDYLRRASSSPVEPVRMLVLPIPVGWLVGESSGRSTVHPYWLQSGNSPLMQYYIQNFHPERPNNIRGFKIRTFLWLSLFSRLGVNPHFWIHTQKKRPLGRQQQYLM